jgi:hypothetical protein
VTNEVNAGETVIANDKANSAKHQLLISEVNEVQDQKNFESPRVNYDSNRDFARVGSDEKPGSETVVQAKPIVETSESGCQTLMFLEDLEMQYQIVTKKHLENQARLIKLEHRPTTFETQTQTDDQEEDTL